MARGDPVIVQGALQAGKWNGRADILRRVETPSRFGAWSYEVTDTKLARETKGNTVLQISLYSDLVSSMQGSAPASAFVVTPGTQYEPEPYRMADYAAYYRHESTDWVEESSSFYNRCHEEVMIDLLRHLFVPRAQQIETAHTNAIRIDTELTVGPNQFHLI